MLCPTRAKFGNSGPHPAPSEARMHTNFAQFWLRKAIAGLPFSVQVKAYFFFFNVWLLAFFLRRKQLLRTEVRKIAPLRKTITKDYPSQVLICQIFHFVKPISFGFLLRMLI